MATEEQADSAPYDAQTREELLQEIERLRCRNAELETAHSTCECHLSEMAGSIHDVFWIFDHAAQKVIYASPAYEEIWGRSVKTLYERYEEWGESIHPDDRASARESLAKVLESGGGEPREYRIIRPDGSIRWISDRAYAVREADGRVGRLTGVAEDITDRKEAEEALRESQARLNAAIESLPFDFFMLDKDERYVMVNSIGRQHWGIHAGLRPEDVCPDEATLALWQDNNRRAFAGEVVRGEVEMAPQGSPGTFYNIISPIRDGHEVLGILGVNIDVTAQKQAERALRESEEKFRNLAEQSPNMIFINHAARVVYVNQRCEECMGYTREEFYASDFNFLDLIVPEHRDRLMVNFRRHMQGQEVPPIEYTLLTRTGRHIEAILGTKLITYSGEQAILGIVTDITGQKVAEDELRRSKVELEQRVRERTAELEAEVDHRHQIELALRESEEKYRTLVESAGDAIATVTAEGRILFVNGTVAKQFETTPEAMIGRTMHDYFPQPFADAQVETMQEVLRTGQGANVMAQALIGGALRWFNTTYEPLRIGQGNAVLVISRDVDDLVQTRLQLDDYREQMARADRLASLGTMSAMVAHELTQPLTVLRLSIQNALEAIETGATSTPVIEDLESCVEEVATMTGIIERFRGFARASSPSRQFDIDLAAIAQHMVDLTAEAAARAQVSVSLDGFDQLPGIRARAKDMEQLFFTLLMNAIQAADGTQPRAVHIRGRSADSQIELWFEDTCGGIDPDVLDKIFEPFFTTKADAGGTGLGLCIVEHILSRYRAKIETDNRPGEGVTFKVTLPVSDTPSS